jgi:hypothetical protein
VKKGREPLEKSGIYEIICQDCWKIYYGLSKRRRDDREKEFANLVKMSLFENVGLKNVGLLSKGPITAGMHGNLMHGNLCTSKQKMKIG